jgi:CO/xanthine dehydrogenase FAD-binding subunit
MFIKRLPGFEHHSPASVSEALDLLCRFDGKAAVYAGGTDLLVAMKKREKIPEHLINLKRILQMQGIHADGNEGVRIGALTTLAELERSTTVKEGLSPLWDAVNVMASPQIRSLGTIGGNLCSAMPSADTAPPLITLGASLKIMGPRGERTLPVEQFFQGPGISALKPDEILSHILIPGSSGQTGGAYLKLMRRSGMDLAQIGVAVCISSDSEDNEVCREVRIALGAVAQTPIRAPRAEEYLIHKEMTQTVANEAGRIASREAKPRSSIRASREYREAMIEVLTERAVIVAARRMGAKE